ncbi:preprotein translocase subunit SecY [Candidatus Woesebacteria bacterium]|nr:preprotein translocase subunit SecY [Candidatus Woesebacteria bacterium]
MQYVLTFIKKITASPVVKRKLVFTFLILLFFRMLANIPLPGVNIVQLQSLFASNQFLGLLNIFSGGTLSNFSIVAVGINAFITSSIIMQLAALLIPKLKELQKDGESGRELVNQYTRFLSVPLAIFQSISVLLLLRTQNLLIADTPIALITMIVTLVAGAALLMWLGELITQYGLGNGISMVLLGGILSQIPSAISQIGVLLSGNDLMPVAVMFALGFLVMMLVVFMNEAVRKVTIQYARRVRGSRSYGGQLTHLPIKVNVTGVLPIIFAVTIMLVPSFLQQILIGNANPQLQGVGRWISIYLSQTSPWYLGLYFIIVFVFTFFSALVFFNADDLSKELKKSGAFVPGIRPGSPTKKFLEFVVSRTTFAGAIFLGSIAILPLIAQQVTGIQSLAIGGTSVLIVVSVILETAKQIESQFLEHNYDKYI